MGVHSQANIPFKKLLTVQDIFAVFGGFISFLLIQGLLKCVLQTQECDSRRVGVCALTYNRVLACVLTDVYVHVFIYMSYIYSAVAFLHTCKALYTYIHTTVEEACKVPLCIYKSRNTSIIQQLKKKINNFVSFT